MSSKGTPVDRKSYAQVHDHIMKIMPLLERQPEGFLKHPFIVCAYGLHYANVIACWDCHHMAMRFSYAGKHEYFRHLIDNLMEYQSAKSGLTPAFIMSTEGMLQSSPPLHAHPFLMQGALMYLRQTGDSTWIKSVYDRLKKYLGYFETTMLTHLGLFRWPVTTYGGMDNDVSSFFQPETVVTPDINAWLCLEYLAAAKLAAGIGKDGDRKEFSRKAADLAKTTNDLLWYDKFSTYSAYDLVNGRFILHYDDAYLDETVGRFSFQSCSNLIPLYARMPDAQRARRMIKTYLLNEKHFWGEFGIRSLSRSSNYYNTAIWGNPPRFGDHHRLTNTNWQGPVLILTNYFMFHALRHYGFRKEAGDLADRTIRVLAKSLDIRGSWPENFNPDTGEPLYVENFASWNILADVMHTELKTGKWIMDSVFEPGAKRKSK